MGDLMMDKSVLRAVYSFPLKLQIKGKPKIGMILFKSNMTLIIWIFALTGS